MTVSDSTHATIQTITALLEGLPPESLARVESFVRSLSQSGSAAGPLYPTVAVPASSLKGWEHVLDEGYEGDALADTEALYDET